jgi:hypothetical protein
MLYKYINRAKKSTGSAANHPDFGEETFENNMETVSGDCVDGACCQRLCDDIG